MGQSSSQEEDAPRLSLGCVTGRFQPLHKGHLELLLHVLDLHPRLMVAITNPDPSTRRRDEDSSHRHLEEDNPFTFYERLAFVHAALNEAHIERRRYDVVPFPLHEPDRWQSYVPLEATHYVRAYSPWERKKAKLLKSHGYEVVLIESGDVKEFASGDIRSAMRTGGPWHQWVPESVVPVIEDALAWSSLADRLES